MSTENFSFDQSLENLPEKCDFTWRVPSNIALVKYWGKREPQLPENPSISFTLDACFTMTTLELVRSHNQEEFIEGEFNSIVKQRNIEVYFEGKNDPSFYPKIFAFLNLIGSYVPYLINYDMVIHTRNSFPHSSGIASSASGMAALALCIMSLEKELNPSMTEAYFNQKASFLARLGSGSASRSIEGPLVVWGKSDTIFASSDHYGVRFPYKVHANFTNYHDTILLVDKGEKQVSSTVGHALMHGHPFAKKRFEQANANLDALSEILQNGDLKAFVKIVESEALSLHAMMMTSDPSFILMKPNTLHIIHKIWEFRKQTESNVCFTLDAGANVHVLFPEAESEIVNTFIINELLRFCEKNHYICDRAGTGAKQMQP